MSTGTIKKVAGPLVIAEGMRDANMFDVVRVSSQRLIGEIIEMHGDEASVQVYEETSGLGPAARRIDRRAAERGARPRPDRQHFRRNQRPLETIRAVSGNNLHRGVEVASLSREAVWHFVPTVKAGDAVVPGDIIGTVLESKIITHRIMVPRRH